MLAQPLAAGLQIAQGYAPVAFTRGRQRQTGLQPGFKVERVLGTPITDNSRNNSGPGEFPIRAAYLTSSDAVLGQVGCFAINSA